MGATHIWKLLHLLNIYGPQLSRSTIRAAGYDCDPDTLYALVTSGALEAIPAGSRYDTVKEYRLSDAAHPYFSSASSRIATRSSETFESVNYRPLSSCHSARVGRTRCFPLSSPACQVAGISCLRGDTIERSKDLVSNILQAICEAGIVIIDASAPNPNVYYELGLCEAIGKDYRILKQAGVVLAADLAGTHYIEYSLSNIDAARDRLANELSVWAKMNDIAPIKAEKATKSV
jgi:hypothetical protein